MSTAAITPEMIAQHQLTPEEYGIAIADPADLKGGDAQANARAIRDLFAGVPGAWY